MINTGLIAIGLAASILVDAYGLICGVITFFLNGQIGAMLGLIGTGFGAIFLAYWTSKVAGGGFFKNKRLLKKFAWTTTGETILGGIPFWTPYVITTCIKNWNSDSTAIIKGDGKEEVEEDFTSFINSTEEDFDEPHAEMDLEENTEEEEVEEEEIDDETEEESSSEEE